MAPIPKIDPETGNWQLFLNRSISSKSPTEDDGYKACLAGKRVLITGAGGYIGSALAKSIAQSGAGKLILLDASEGALYEIDQVLSGLKDAAPYVSALVSICDTAALSSVFDQHRPEIVFHAAAFKHVPLMESNPFAAVANNALGTQVLAETAAEYGCEQMLMISTDKAVDPHSIMGASKRIAELIMLAPRTGPVCMKVVRLGNVLGSTGSVVPLFLRQIAQGGPVTVSHRDVRRYFMTLTETIDALLFALSSDLRTALLVPEPGDPVRILDLARYLIGPESKVPIVFTELRPGDKMEESLISPRESYQNISSGPLQAIYSPVLPLDQLSAALDDLRIALQQRSLPSLLRVIQRMVPEYCPSLQLREHLHTSVAATVNA